jgi:predicted nucleic acid-binding protein
VDCLFDTSAVFALLVPRDQHHFAARAFAQQSSLRLFTNSVIVGEAFTLIRSRQGYELAMRWVRSVRASHFVSVEHLLEAEDAQVWQRLESLRGIELSYADASLIVLAQRLGIRRVFTFDDDFSRAGLEVMPGEP